MTRAGSHGWRVIACLCASACALPAHAAAPPVAEPAYEDRLIDGGALAPELEFDQPANHNPDGLPRAMRLTLFRTQMGGVRADGRIENGLIYSTFAETANHGVWSFDGALSFDARGIATYWQRDIPFDDGWRANLFAGMSNPLGIGLISSQTRFLLPATSLLGAGTQWQQRGGLEVNASAGSIGAYTGLRVPEFKQTGGSIASAGAQWQAAPGLYLGAQMLATRDAIDFWHAGAEDPRVSSASVYAGAAWLQPGARTQLNLLSSHSGREDRVGAWLDYSERSGRYDQQAGLFRLPTGLRWGQQPVASNLQGGYYRATYQSRQWLASGGIDLTTPVAGTGSTITFLTGNLRHQWSSELGVGGGANLRQGGGQTAWSASAYLDRALPWVSLRQQIDVAHSGTRSDVQVNLDQSWQTRLGTRLSTAVFAGQERDDQFGSARRIGVAAYGGADLIARMSLDGSARWAQFSGSRTGHDTSANVALNWRPVPELVLGLNYYESYGSQRLPLVVDSPIQLPTLPVAFSQRDRGVYLSLTYEQTAGTAFVPLGGAARDGAGRVAGTLFLDANHDGQMNAGEGVAPNVTVLLDGRYAARTDSRGNFEFPAVAPGRHHLVVVQDNLPLPWTLKDEGRVEFDVRVRETARVEVGAQKLL